MKKRRRIFWSIGLAALGAVAWVVLHSVNFSEPSYRGKSLTKWLLMLESPTPQTASETTAFELRREKVREALVRMGTNALPQLVGLLTTNPPKPWLEEKIQWINREQNFIQFPESYQHSWPTLALEGFRLMGTNAEAAVPELWRILESVKSDLAAQCLLAIGPASVPSFIGGLTNKNPRLQLLSLWSLGEMGPLAYSAIPILTRMAEQSIDGHPGTAMCVLSEVETNAVKCLPLFTRHFMGANHQKEAAIALWRIGPIGIPILLSGLTNSNRSLQIFALAALHSEMSQQYWTGRESETADFRLARIAALYYSKTTWVVDSMRGHIDPPAHLLVPVIARNFRFADAALKAVLTRLAVGYGLQGVPVLSVAASDDAELARSIASDAVKRLDLEIHRGGVIRGPKNERRLALIFSAHEFAEGGDQILKDLAAHHAMGSFFLTGHFLDRAEFASLIQLIVASGHYLGSHSDQHPLLCSWEPTPQLLVSRLEFRQDLSGNLAKMRRFIEVPKVRPGQGFPARKPGIFLPPFEHYNQDIANWASEWDCTLINFTPGTRSNADYTREADTNFVSSQVIFDSIVQWEREDPYGLNGFILLFHLGSGPGRTDKFHHRFGELLDYLSGKGYQFVRVDELLEPKPEEERVQND